MLANAAGHNRKDGASSESSHQLVNEGAALPEGKHFDGVNKTENPVSTYDSAEIFKALEHQADVRDASCHFSLFQGAAIRRGATRCSSARKAGCAVSPFPTATAAAAASARLCAAGTHGSGIDIANTNGLLGRGMLKTAGARLV